MLARTLVSRLCLKYPIRSTQDTRSHCINLRIPDIIPPITHVFRDSVWSSVIRVSVTFQSNHQIGVAVHRTRAPVLGRRNGRPACRYLHVPATGPSRSDSLACRATTTKDLRAHAGMDNRMRVDEMQSTFTGIPHTARDDALSMRMDLSLERDGTAKLRPDKPKDGCDRQIGYLLTAPQTWSTLLPEGFHWRILHGTHCACGAHPGEIVRAQ